MQVTYDLTVRLVSFHPGSLGMDACLSVNINYTALYLYHNSLNYISTLFLQYTVLTQPTYENYTAVGAKMTFESSDYQTL